MQSGLLSSGFHSVLPRSCVSTGLYQILTKDGFGEKGVAHCISAGSWLLWRCQFYCNWILKGLLGFPCRVTAKRENVNCTRHYWTHQPNLKNWLKLAHWKVTKLGLTTLSKVIQALASTSGWILPFRVRLKTWARSASFLPSSWCDGELSVSGLETNWW